MVKLSRETMFFLVAILLQTRKRELLWWGFFVVLLEQSCSQGAGGQAMIVGDQTEWIAIKEVTILQTEVWNTHQCHHFSHFLSVGKISTLTNDYCIFQHTPCRHAQNLTLMFWRTLCSYSVQGAQEAIRNGWSWSRSFDERRLEWTDLMVGSWNWSSLTRWAMYLLANSTGGIKMTTIPYHYSFLRLCWVDGKLPSLTEAWKER